MTPPMNAATMTVSGIDSTPMRRICLTVSGPDVVGSPSARPMSRRKYPRCPDGVEEGAVGAGYPAEDLMPVRWMTGYVSVGCGRPSKGRS